MAGPPDGRRRGVRIPGTAAVQQGYLKRIDLHTLTDENYWLPRGIISGRVSAALKRLCDLVIGCCLLVGLLPVMAVTAMAIKIDSRGPIFDCQRCVGWLDKPFTLFKFRSLTSEGCGPRWTRRADPRITRVGRFIRASRIDRLPQLANVVRGEMSLVGPRPERPHQVGQLARAIPFYHQRHDVRPGLTGWAQVNLRGGASVEDAREKLAYDLFYVKNRSTMLDLIILISTVRVVLLRQGTG
jgi:lipopolysaccharide/colanic/teichoic acid biosynthesis glycosyltransferase